MVVFISLGAVFAYFVFFKKSQPLVSPVAESPSVVTETPTVSPAVSQGEYNLLLMGQGDPSHEGSQLTDSMMVLNIKTKEKTASLIFIPRDLWVKLPQAVDGKEEVKINEAYSLGGLKLSEQVVGNVTGLPIQYSALIDFNHFSKLIDSLGGIDIIITKSFDDYYYPIAGKELETCGKSTEELSSINATMSGFLLEQQFACRYEHLHFDAGKTHLDGATALKFARSRHSDQDGTDFGRGSRQQIVLIGIKNKLISLDVLKNIDQLFASLFSLVKTDLDLPSVKAAASLMTDLNDYKINQVVLSLENVLKDTKNSQGQYILVPKAGDGNWAETREFIKKQLD